MEFFNKKQDVIDLQLTNFGRHLLSKGKFKPVYYSFFNMDNVYFWFILGGLLLLAVGLLFLLMELKKNQPKKIRIKEPKPVKQVKEKKIEKKKEEPKPVIAVKEDRVEKKKEEPKPVKKKPIKVKVIKVK